MRNLVTAVGKGLLSCVVLAGLVVQGEGANLAPGTKIEVRLSGKLDTGESKAGQSFSGTVAQPVVLGGKTVLARGASVRGQVMEVVSSGRLKKPASITLTLTQAGGAALRTEPLRIDAKSHLVRNAELIGGGAGAGALLGALAGGKKGALIGAGIGAGAGTATAYLTGKKEIVLPPETALAFVVASGRVAAATGSTASRATQPRTSQAARGEEGEEGTEEGAEEEEIAFSPHDQALIRRYFRTNTENLPPGLAKRGGNLPPGLEKHLERDGTLPPGLQKRVEPFPAELDRQLPRLPSGYSRVVLSGRALIMDRANKILDMMFIYQ